MALITHHIQGSYATFTSRPSSWTRGIKLKQYVTTRHKVGRAERCKLLRRNICLSVGAPCICEPKLEPLRILAFKGSSQNDESGGRANGSNVSKNSTKLKDGDNSSTQTPKANSIPLSFPSEANEDIAPSPAIHKLFKKWLTLLRTEPPLSQEVDGILGHECSREMSETQQESQKMERGEILKAVWFHFLDLDATIKIPLLIFAPLYLAVNVLYGREVSKELTPLWVFGPLIVAFYVKMFNWLCALYIFTFKKSATLIKNLPTYYKMASSYIMRGELKEEVRARVYRPLLNIKNLDYKEVLRKKLKEMEVAIVEKYLDFVESIWPFYCRTIRFLKRANLI